MTGEGSTVITQNDLRKLVGATAHDPSGDKIGRIGQVYYDDDTDQPKWVTVHTGLFGTNESFVPLQGARFEGGIITLGYDKQKIKNAPNVAPDRHLSPDEEAQLYRYYDIRDFNQRGTDDAQAGGRHRATSGRQRNRGTVRDDPDARDDARRGRTRGRDTSNRTTDTAMTRSEEQLRVGTETHETGRVRLRKHVVTEHQNVTVPVSREEVTVEREPITDANRGAAHSGPAISAEEHEVTLSAERPVVEKEAVPVERVRLGTETRTQHETVGGEVRKEQIEVDADDRPRRDRDERRS
jgi:uncharacterized protein (TIGR02271 family)